MSTLFWDGIVDFGDLKILIAKTGSSGEEREELDALVDSTINPKVIKAVLDELPEDSHNGFLELFTLGPHDKDKIFGFIGEKKGLDIRQVEEMLRDKLIDVKNDLLKELNPQDEVSTEIRVSTK